MLKALRLVALSALLVAVASAQSLFYGVPQPPASITISQVGTAGATQYCYWVVAVYPGGKSAPTGPACTFTANSTLSTTNYDVVTFLAPTSPFAAVSSYDILRTTTQTVPTGACACAVATAQSGSPINDQSNSLSAYTVATLAPTTGQWFADGASTASNTLLRARLNGVETAQWVNPASTVNIPVVTNGATGTGVTFGAGGPSSDTNVPVTIAPKGTAPVLINGSGLSAFYSNVTAADTTTLTITQFFNAILSGTPTAAANYTTPTAAAICSALAGVGTAQGASGGGNAADLWIRNTSGGANTITVLAGTGVTLTGTMTIAQNNFRHFKIVANSTPCTTVQVFGLDSGAF